MRDVRRPTHNALVAVTLAGYPPAARQVSATLRTQLSAHTHRTRHLRKDSPDVERQALPPGLASTRRDIRRVVVHRRCWRRRAQWPAPPSQTRRIRDEEGCAGRADSADDGRPRRFTHRSLDNHARQVPRHLADRSPNRRPAFQHDHELRADAAPIRHPAHRRHSPPDVDRNRPRSTLRRAPDDGTRRRNRPQPPYCPLCACVDHQRAGRRRTQGTRRAQRRTRSNTTVSAARASRNANMDRRRTLAISRPHPGATLVRPLPGPVDDRNSSRRALWSPLDRRRP